MPIVVIVDGYSTSTHYAKVFSESGYDCLHIQSNKELPKFIVDELKTSDYIGITVHEALNNTIDWILSYGEPMIIIPGSDSGILLADVLSNYFKCKSSNLLETSLARRDKYEMGELIRNLTLRAIKQKQSSQIDEALNWIKEQELKYPIVVKPLKSGSGEGFSLCKNEEDIAGAFSRYLGQKDLFNQLNEKMLVQEYIQGVEYVVNTVSCEGKHYVSEIARHNKMITEDGKSLYISTDFLSLNDPVADILSPYIKEVLTALGVNYGPAHAEIFIDQNGPVLVEVGCRPMGSSLNPNIITSSYGHNHVDLAILCYTIDPKEFHSICGQLSKNINQYLSLAYYFSNKEGYIESINLEAFQNLNSFIKLDKYVREGQLVKKAENLDDAIFMIYLQHHNSNLIEEDILKIKELENTDYVLTFKTHTLNSVFFQNGDKKVIGRMGGGENFNDKDLEENQQPTEIVFERN